MDSIRSVVCFFAHPDDESFVCGGTLARFHKQGAKTIVVCATDGRKGGKGYHRQVSPSTMKKMRKREIQQSAKILGVTKLVCWHYRDKELAGASWENICTRIQNLLARYRPDLIITFGKGGVSGHPDHIAIGKCVTACTQHMRGVRLWHASFRKRVSKGMFLHDSKTNPPNVFVQIGAFRALKLKSIQVHKSQVFTRSRIGRRGERAPRDFFTTETFYQVSPRAKKQIRW